MAKSIDSLSKNTPAGGNGSIPPTAPTPAKSDPTPSSGSQSSNDSSSTPPTPTDPVKETPTPQASPDPSKAETSASANPVSAPLGSSAKPTPASGTTNPDSYESLFPEPSVVIESPPQWIWWILLIIGSALLGLAGFKLTNNHLDSWLSGNHSPSPESTQTASASATPSASSSPTTAATATPTPAATATAMATATPTPSDTASKASITLRVLNGTTVNGAAAAAKTTLQQAGFTVRTVGNAVNQNYASSFIYYQAGKINEAKLVQLALPKYSFTLQESTLANPDNVLVVIGLK